MTEEVLQPSRSKVSDKEFVVLVASLMSIVAITIDALLPAFGAIMTDLPLPDPNRVQYLITVFFIGLAIGQLVCGPCSDALGRKKVLYIGIALYMAGSVVCFRAQTFDALLVGRLIEGLGVAGPYVSAVSIVRDKYGGRQMAKVMSLVMTIFILVPAVAPSLGQAILLVGSWREIFLLYLVYAVVIGVWLFLRLEETLPPEKRIAFRLSDMARGFREVVRSPTTVRFTLCMGLCFGSFFGYLNSSQQIFQVQFGAGKMFTVYFGLLALTLGIASLQNSRFVERYGMHHICVRSFLCIIAASAVFLVIVLSIDVPLWLFLFYAAVLFFCFGLIFGNLNAMAMEPMGHIAGIASAIIGSVSSMISLVLGTIIGQLYNNTLVPVVIGFLTLSMVSLWLVMSAEGRRVADVPA